MKKLAVILTIALALATAANALSESDKLAEKILLLQFAQDLSLDDADMAELLVGYAEFREAMDALEAKRADAASALEAAIAAGNNADISAKMRAVVAADKAIFDATQSVIAEAGTLLNTAEVAKLYLLVSNLDAARQALRAQYAAGPCPAAQTCPVAAAPATAVAEAPALSPEEEVMAQVKAIMADFLAGNADKLLDYISEEFEHHQVGDKAAVANYLQMGKDTGKVDEFKQWVKDHDGQISLDDAEVTFKDGEAAVYPIDASATIGSVSVELIFKKDPDGVWRVIGAYADGM